MIEIKYLATSFFILALLHTFSVGFFARLAKKFHSKSVQYFIFHLLSEVEIVFGFWAILFMLSWSFLKGATEVIEYQLSLSMTEPLFIFCIMMLAASRPIVTLARRLILSLTGMLTKLVKAPQVLIEIFVLLTIGPLLGSLITEPAAITIVALLLYRVIDENNLDQSLLYFLLATMFVNVSVGGALTHFAAPPILMVAHKWSWGLKDVFMNLGEAAVATVVINALMLCFLFKNKIIKQFKPIQADHYPMPYWVIGVHLLFLIGLVVNAHEPKIFIWIFLIFIAFASVKKKYQDGLKWKESFLVGFFLAGLVVFGSFQKWWVEPAIQKLSEKFLFLLAACLTAVTDNAALTYLGSQVESMTESAKWALVAGALVGGGLTILANAPNPAGFSILASKFQNASLNSGKLFLASLLPTVVAGLCFFFLGNF